jgi:hypothetical protein
MSHMKKLLKLMASQIKTSGVTLPISDTPHKIQDNNLAIHNGVIYEESNAGMRSAPNGAGKRKRGRKPKRQD